ncbi:MAG: cytochrome c [Acidimicrobiales bacterium]
MVLAAIVIAGAGASCSGETTATPAERGKAVAMRAGCTSCHGATSIRGLGPTWTGVAGSTVKLDDGTTVVADTAYLTESIRSPAAKKVAGYSIAMPAVQLSNEDVIALVAYIESLAAKPATTTGG